MKRLNPKTNKFFVQGDRRDDGFLFWGYVKTHTLKNGFFKENWLNTDAFNKKRNKNNDYLKNQRLCEPKKYAESAANWQKHNPSKVCGIASKRRAAKLNRTPKWLTTEHFEQIADIYKMAKELETIFPWKQHIDHIVPLQNTIVSGLHVPWNLQILSAKMNYEKGNIFVEDL